MPACGVVWKRARFYRERAKGDARTGAARRDRVQANIRPRTSIDKEGLFKISIPQPAFLLRIDTYSEFSHDLNPRGDAKEVRFEPELSSHHGFNRVAIRINQSTTVMLVMTFQRAVELKEAIINNNNNNSNNNQTN